MKSHVVFVSGDISKSSNVGVGHIKHVCFLKQRQGHSPSSVLPAPTLGETFRKTGMPPCILAGENLLSNPHKPQAIILFLSWIYAQFIAIDANFRLKLKNRLINDPELGSGWSYFVENSAYTRHVNENAGEEEARHVLNDGCLF